MGVSHFMFVKRLFCLEWKAVDWPELHHLTDVIVLPTTGDRRAADLLSGGIIHVFVHSYWLFISN